MKGLRYANIGLGVMMVTSVVGLILFRDAGKGAMRASVWVSVFIGFVVYLGLDWRAERRERRDQ